MANTATLTNLQDAALDYAEMTTGFIDSTRLTGYINSGLVELHDLFLNSYQDYLMTEQSIALVSGTETYALATDYWKTLGVFYVDVASTTRIRLNRFDVQQHDGYRAPTQAGTVKHWYAPQFVKLSAGSDVVNVTVPVAWEDFVAIHAAIRCLLRSKLKDDAMLLMQERERMRERMVTNAAPRDSHSQQRVVDVYARWAPQVPFANNRGLMYCVVGNNMRILEGLVR